MALHLFYRFTKCRVRCFDTELRVTISFVKALLAALCTNTFLQQTDCTPAYPPPLDVSLCLPQTAGNCDEHPRNHIHPGVCACVGVRRLPRGRGSAAGEGEPSEEPASGTRAPPTQTATAGPSRGPAHGHTGPKPGRPARRSVHCCERKEKNRNEKKKNLKTELRMICCICQIARSSSILDTLQAARTESGRWAALLQSPSTVT